MLPVEGEMVVKHRSWQIFANHQNNFRLVAVLFDLQIVPCDKVLAKRMVIWSKYLQSNSLPFALEIAFHNA